MSYKISAKNRKVKKILQIFLMIISFWWNNFPLHNKMIFFWIIIWFLSLFMNWFEWEKISWNSFSWILWITGFLFFLLYLKIFFILFFTKITEKIKFILKINLKNWILITIIWVFGFWTAINTIFIIKNISLTFDSSMIIWIIWLSVNIVWFIFIIIWWILYNYSKKEVYVYTDNKKEDEILDEIINKDTNMKLPF